MTEKKGRTLKNILYAAPFVVSALFHGCQKEVMPEGAENPPKINILSPLEGQSFKYDKAFPIAWKIEYGGELEEAYISVNDGPKFPIYSKTGSLNWATNDFANKVVIGAKGKYSKISKDSTTSYNWTNPMR